MKLSIPFNKAKYLDIVASQGFDNAITALHDDIAQWEYEAFEGPQGYQPQMIEDLVYPRAFSRELWDQSMRLKD